MFKKILIANRGEIAVRIIRTCKRMGIENCCCIFRSGFRAAYVQEADEATCIGPAASQESYLAKEKIIGAALAYGCQAVHPGYGFLSENCRILRRWWPTRAWLLSVLPLQPSPALETRWPPRRWRYGPECLLCLDISTMSSQTWKRPLPLPKQIGFPVLLKPAAGGGGRGMRIVSSREEMAPALAACREETRKSFADDRIFMERYITRPRHIEIQIMADQLRPCESTWVKESAPYSAGTKKSSKRPRLRWSMMRSEREWDKWPVRWPLKPGTPMQEQWNSSWMKKGISISWK